MFSCARLCVRPAETGTIHRYYSNDYYQCIHEYYGTINRTQHIPTNFDCAKHCLVMCDVFFLLYSICIAIVFFLCVYRSIVFTMTCICRHSMNK